MSQLRGLCVLATLSLAAFMTMLDNTVLNVALPRIQRDLGLGLSNLEWVAAAYPLTFTTLLLLGGHLADAWGRRPTLTTGLAVFTVSSLLCSFSYSGATLILYRSLQGTGAALILPASLAVLTHDVPPRTRNIGVAVWTIALAAALALGPVVSGLISQRLGWRWIFTINGPMGTLALAMTMSIGGVAIGKSSSRASAKGTSRLPNPAGMMLSCLAFGGCTYGLIEGHRYGFASPRIISTFALSSIALGLFVAHQAMTRTPMVNIKLFRQRAFSGCIAAQFLWGMGITGIFFFTSLFLQHVLSFSPTKAGLAFTPVAMFLVLTAPLVPIAVRRCGAHRVSAIGLVMVALGLQLLAHVGQGAHPLDLLPGLGAIGVGSALCAPLTTRAIEAAPHSSSGIASGLLTAAREASGTLSIALLGAIVVHRQSQATRQGANANAAFLQGYQTGLVVASLLVAVAAPVAWWALRTQAPSDSRRDP